MISFTRAQLLIFLVPIILCLFTYGWMFTGYAKKQSAEIKSLLGLAEEAQTGFTQAAALIPWSSTIHYEFAKSYIRQGNTSRNTSYYKLAKKQLEEALERLPEQQLYRSLLDDITKKGF